MYDRQVRQRVNEYLDILGMSDDEAEDMLPAPLAIRIAPDVNRARIRDARARTEADVVMAAKRNVLHYQSAQPLLFFGDARAAGQEEEDDNRAEAIMTLANPLLWWRKHGDDYLYVSLLVRWVLCVQATSAPTERLFSRAGITIKKDRANLKPDNTEEVVFCHVNWELVQQYNAEKRRRTMDNNED
jgi:hypothetical protein